MSKKSTATYTILNFSPIIHWTLVLVLMTASVPGFAQQERPLFSTLPVHAPERLRNVTWSPFLSLVLPSFDQWWEGQTDSALLYSGIAATGIGVATSANKKIEEQGTAGLGDLEDSSDYQRQYLIGWQTYQMAGSMSAYHSFRTAVHTQKKFGRYKFLKHEESSTDIFKAPFRFDFLLRPSTFVPLGIGAFLAASYVGAKENKRTSFRGKDFLTASAISYNAGTGEEALFRGWMMPFWQQTFQSEFLSNATTAAIFAAAHISADNPVPWAQFAMGYYLGFVTQKNEWKLSESVFVHTWWDVLLLSAYMAAREDIYMPVVQLAF